jgi:serine/threonine protein kinase
MDYYEGARTLASVIRERPNPYHGNVLKCLDTLKFLVLAVRSCELSKPQIIHRDINPKNILILPDGSLRLIDFGICQFDDGHLITLTDENVGTRDFTAPECEAGNEAEIGLHSDLYSVGKVLWSMVTSQRGFAREKPVFGIKSMKSVLPDIPNACHLDRIFFRTIRSNIKNRISKTEELLNLIQETRYLVEAGFPNIYEINQRCPSCGYPAVKQFEGGHNVFGNPNPENVHSVICGRCGFGFVRNISFLRDELQQFLEAD